MKRQHSGTARLSMKTLVFKGLARMARLLLPEWLRGRLYACLPFSLRAKWTPGTHPRVLFVGDAYYMFWFLSRALRALGWSADTLRTDRVAGDRTFLHDTDLTLTYRGTLDRVRHMLFLLQSIWRYDVFHFYGVGNIRLLHADFDWTLSGILPASWDIKLLRRFGKRIVYTDIGCPDGVLQTSMLGLSGEVPCLTCRWVNEPGVCSDTRTHAWGQVRNNLADMILAQGAWHKDYNDSPKLRETPEMCCLDTQFWSPDLVVPANYRLPFPKGTVVLYHAVGNFALRTDLRTNRNLKSTHIYLDVVDKLQAEGYPVELAFFHSVPNTEVRFYQIQADIVVDMLTYGWFGANVREALMLGKPVVCYIRPDWLENVRRENPEYADELPIVTATPETVYDVLRGLIEHPEKRAEIGRRSREFAVKWHSPDAAAARMSKLYVELLLQ